MLETCRLQPTCHHSISSVSSCSSRMVAMVDMVLNRCILLHLSSHGIARIHAGRSCIWITLSLPRRSFYQLLLNQILGPFVWSRSTPKAPPQRKTVATLRKNKTPLLHIIMGTPSNPLLSGRNTKQAPYGNQQSPIRGRQGAREREGGRRRPLAPSQKTNYRTEMVPCRKASKRKGNKTETSILGTQKTNGQPKQRRLRKTRWRVRENGQNHSRRSSSPPLRFWKTKTGTYPTSDVPSKTLQQKEEAFRKQTLSPALLLRILEEMMTSRRKRERSLIDAAAAANADAAPASTAERFNCDGGAREGRQL
jgi:hypothetical protein